MLYGHLANRVDDDDTTRSTAHWIPFDIGVWYTPVEIPRDASIVLRFSEPVDTTSLALDSSGRLTPDGPVQVVSNGRSLALRAFVSGHDVILDPTGDHAGFPLAASSRGAGGEALRDPAGSTKLMVATGHTRAVRSRRGVVLSPRRDLLGSPGAGGAAIGFHPTPPARRDPPATTYGLPGAPGSARVIRAVDFDGVFNTAIGDVMTVDQLSVVLGQAFDTASTNGKGEWKGGYLVLRPGAVNQERRQIVSNTASPAAGGQVLNTISLRRPVSQPLQTGEAYRLIRSERFEPDPNNPIDPQLFDPLNPELLANQDLANFAVARDRNGQPQDLSQPIDPLSTFEFNFDRPMREGSFLAYESFRVTDDPPSANPGENQVGRVEVTEGGRRVIFHPDREVQFGPAAGTAVTVGFGPAASALRFHLVTVPSEPELIALLGAAAAQAFVDQGVRGLEDATGLRLGFPSAFPTTSMPFVDYSFPFATAADPSLVDVGVVVHRFQGRPQSASGTANGLPITGVTFSDMPAAITGPNGNIYGNNVVEFDLAANGFLSGAPVQFFQKIHDDFNPPPSGQLIPFPFGTATPIGGAAVLGGVRFQHVYRAVDASPDWVALSGTELDLFQLGFAPIGGGVMNTVLPDLSIHAGHTSVIPDTKQISGIPALSQTGLTGSGNQTAMGGHFAVIGNPNTAYVEGPYDGTVALTGEEKRRELVHGELKPGALADQYDGRSFQIDNSNLFVPAGSSRTYHPLPDASFDHPFPYNNGARDQKTFGPADGFDSAPTWGGQLGERRPQSLLLEYRVRVKDPTSPPAVQNGFTFAIGILSSALPRFRVFSIGTGCTSCCLAGGSALNAACKNTCQISTNPAMTGLPGSGGVPLEPDMIRNAAGPAPAPPGMACFCLGPPQNPAQPPVGCQDTVVGAPTVDQVAYGLVPNPSLNNFGDNSRYFMLFNYVKRRSFVYTPFVRAQDPSVIDPTWLTPIVHGVDGAALDGVELAFRASATGVVSDATEWVSASDMATPNNPLNGAVPRPFLQARVTLVGDTSTLLVPAVEEVAIPFEK